MAAILSWCWCGLVGMAIFRAFRQRNAIGRLAEPVTLADPAAEAIPAAKVAVIVPARDEAGNIGPCVRSLLAQDYPALRVVVVDDDSTDETAAIVAELAAGDPRLELVRAPALPVGWKGKVYACCVGTELLPPDVDWICFLDADMRCESALLRAAVATAAAEGLDLLSLAPRHTLGSFAERLMIPCGLYLLSFTQNLNRIQAPDSEDAVATGQFMLFRREAYDRIGGHASVYGAICEDVELARLCKRRGFKVLLKDGSAHLGTRMYTGWHSLWPGIAKNLTDMLGGPAATVIAALAAMLVPWAALLLPPLDVFGCAHSQAGACIAAIPALVGSGAAFGLHIAGAAYFRIPFWYGFLFPLAYATGGVLALDSLRQRLVGRIPWKGRVYQ